MTYTIRRLTRADLESDSFWPLLWDAAGVDADALIWIRDVELPGLEVIGAVDGDEVAGFAAYRIRPARLDLEYIAVADAHRHRGLGTRLVQAVRQERVQFPLHAETDDDAVDFYRALGFTVSPAPHDARWPGRQRFACDIAAPGDSADPLTGTLATYAQNPLRYAERTKPQRSVLVDLLTGMVPAGARVLELGSGPGRDADALEERGLVVDRTDGAAPFVALQHAAGHRARVLDVRADDFGGPYDAIFASAVLHHVPQTRLVGVLATARRAVAPGGVIVATFRRGSGDEWSQHKLDAPRYFAYWTPAQLRDQFAAAGWGDIDARDADTGHPTAKWISVSAVNPVTTD